VWGWLPLAWQYALTRGWPLEKSGYWHICPPGATADIEAAGLKGVCCMSSFRLIEGLPPGGGRWKI